MRSSISSRPLSLLRAPVKAERKSKRAQHGASRQRIRKPGLAVGLRRLLMPAAGVAVLLLGVVAAQFVAPLVHGWADGPVRTVRVQGEMRFQNPVAVRRELESMQLGSFFGLDMHAIQRRIESLQWVQTANLRRTWPSTLEITVTEQTPIAIWGGDALLSEQGELFKPDNVMQIEGLPQFDGPAGFELQMMQAYAGFSPLLGGADLQIEVLRLSARGAWEIELSSGQLLRLGRTETLRRLERFAALHQRYLGERLATVAVVDARYSHGIAVTWKPGIEPVEEEQG